MKGVGKRISRIHVDALLTRGQRIALPPDASGHLLRVLRMDVGDRCVLFNGDGHDYAATLIAAERKIAEVEIVDAELAGHESPLQICLLQALARGEKMDWIIQKAVELGVTAIAPVISERTEVKLDGERAEKRRAHWRAVAIAACEQSGRARVPEISEPQPLNQCVSVARSGVLRLALQPGAASGLRDLQLFGVAAIELAVGPEGGWSTRDLGTLIAAGFKPVRLGPRVMRTETAGVAAIAALQGIAGDLG